MCHAPVTVFPIRRVASTETNTRTTAQRARMDASATSKRAGFSNYRRFPDRSPSGIQLGERFSAKAAIPSRASGPRKIDQSMDMRSGLP